MISNSFKKCSISNSLDGSEDDLLYSSDTEISEPDHVDLTEIVDNNDMSADELDE